MLDFPDDSESAEEASPDRTQKRKHIDLGELPRVGKPPTDRMRQGTFEDWRETKPRDEPGAEHSAHPEWWEEIS